jgi:hypothetical protein
MAERKKLTLREERAQQKKMMAKYVDNVFAHLRRNPGRPVPMRKLAETQEMKPWLPPGFPEEITKKWGLNSGKLADLS